MEKYAPCPCFYGISYFSAHASHFSQGFNAKEALWMNRNYQTLPFGTTCIISVYHVLMKEVGVVYVLTS